MKEELLKQLVEKTFANIASPLQCNGVYNEIQNAIMEAYSLGAHILPVQDQDTAPLNAAMR